ncbi:MAG: FHA domain-containing protein [Desulfobacterales bacterium]|nr:FHA domain-containing protein [Desulfobacterales bacterium]
MPSIKFIDLLDRKNAHVIDGTDFMLGRAEECVLQIHNPEISRHQARIQFEQGKYRITNTGRKPIDINGQPVTAQGLEDGDLLHMAGTRFLVRILHATSAATGNEAATTEDRAALKEKVTQGGAHLVLENGDGAEKIFSLAARRVMIGRSAEAHIRFDEKTVSRRHAQIEKSDGAFWVENLSRSATLEVNGRPAKRQRLHSGDQIQIGPHALVFISKRTEDARVELDAAPEQTIFAGSAPVVALAPRLILDTGGDTARTFHLERDRLILGRSAEADIRLEDPSVSRIHGAIEKEEDGYVAVNLCNQNPLKINQETVTRMRLYSGDRLQLGTTVLSFMSDRPEDTRIAATQPPLPVSMRSHPMVRAAFMGLILVLGVYVGYQRLYLPWNASHVLDRAAGIFADGHYEKGREIIEGVIGQGPTAEQAEKAKRLLADATLKMLQRLITSGDDDAALALLAAYLPRHGTEAEASLVWREQDRLHLKLGEKLEKAGQNTVAMQQYARVRADSIHFAKAEERLSRLWRTTQVESLLGNRRGAAAAALLKTGEKRYGTRRYFFPVNQSAYLAFGTALWLVPDHLRAREKLAAMGRFHRDRGGVLIGAKNWAEAAATLHLALLVDPSHAGAIGQLNDCRRKLASMTGKADKTLNKASRTIKQIAMAQQKLATTKTATLVTDLLDTARTAAEGQNDLTPYGKNAYTAFTAVLEIDPENARARTGLESLHSRVRKQGLDVFAAGLWEDAERYLEGMLLIDPEDSEIRERLIDCQKKRVGRTGSGRQQTETASWFSTYLKDS